MDDIPFLKPKDRESLKGVEFPEVQEAMKEAYPLLRSQGKTSPPEVELVMASLTDHPLSILLGFEIPNGCN